MVVKAAGEEFMPMFEQLSKEKAQGGQADFVEGLKVCNLVYCSCFVYFLTRLMSDSVDHFSAKNRFLVDCLYGFWGVILALVDWLTLVPFWSVISALIDYVIFRSVISAFIDSGMFRSVPILISSVFFQVYDKEECGKILGAEIRHALMALGERLSKDEVEEIMKGVEDAEGMVNYDAFVKKVLAGPFPDE